MKEREREREYNKVQNPSGRFENEKKDGGE